MTTTTDPAPEGRRRRRRSRLLSNAEVRRRTRVLMFIHDREIAEGADIRQQVGAAQSELQRAEQETQRLRGVVAEIRRRLPQHADVIDAVAAGTPALVADAGEAGR
ncbi:hypothetical protein [Amycolatopsis solani]|uniref:hypothetical protein n=1 Tax=Amycolatopsis solani TaxID=3028615 RepID=UPI0025AF9D0A|nr:hypothetical protein [Amycolatopsis sp. MEP2-6]